MKILNTYRHVLAILITAACLTACIDQPQEKPDPRGTFRTLWQIIDQHYCFLNEKKQLYGTDWKQIYHKYDSIINKDMTQKQLYEVLTDMLSLLKDGHVNLYTAWDIGRYWSWYQDFPPNYDQHAIESYLKNDYMIAGGLKYKILDDNIAYIRCETFEHEIPAGNLDHILLNLMPANGLIIDVRNNPGGLVTSADALASRFINAKTLAGYSRHKTGTGWDDFSPFAPQYLKPSKGVRWQKPVVVISNRKVYSAANEFVKYMKPLKQVTILGDKTGGGGGLPFTGELPNGWKVRFSACPMYDPDKKSVEQGIEPHINVSLTPQDIANGRCTLIEQARKILAKKTTSKPENSH